MLLRLVMRKTSEKLLLSAKLLGICLETLAHSFSTAKAPQVVGFGD